MIQPLCIRTVKLCSNSNTVFIECLLHTDVKCFKSICIFFLLQPISSLSQQKLGACRPCEIQEYLRRFYDPAIVIKWAIDSYI